MSKELKDYLHLYLGCEVKWNTNIVTLIDTDGINCNVFGEPLFSKSNTSIKNIKPILRPLSDMTEDEHKEWQNIRFNREFKLKPVLTDAEYESFRYLLSKHFDLFGLIEAGLAIDATTLKQTT
jgi:hypothetical protein